MCTSTLKLGRSYCHTSDPFCPSSVRRAKHISRAIQAKFAAYSLAESDAEIEITRSAGALLKEKNDSSVIDDDNSSIFGARKRKRKTGASGTPSKDKKAEDVLLEHVGAMTEHIGSIPEVLLSSASCEVDGNQLKKENVVQIVQQEVRNSMRPTNQMLERMMDMIRANPDSNSS